MSHCCIIGLGSPHGADRIGWQAIEYLRHREKHDVPVAPDTTLHCCSGPHELPQLLHRCSRATLIDACRAPVGELKVYAEDDIATGCQQLSAHGLDAVEMLTLSRLLFTPPPQVRVVGIGIGDNEETPIDDIQLEAIMATLWTILRTPHEVEPERDSVTRPHG